MFPHLYNYFIRDQYVCNVPLKHTGECYYNFIHCFIVFLYKFSLLIRFILISLQIKQIK